ncbi:MAG TPA: ABC transporter substrate-binding protein, partial [Humisphaera sp.]
VCFIDPFQGFVGAKFSVETLKAKKAATLYNRSQSYSTGLNAEFVKAFKSLGGTVVIEQAYGDGDNEFSAQLSAIKAQNPDVIYVPGYYNEIIQIAPQARQRGITVPLVGGDGWVSDKLKQAGSALDNCYFSDHYAQEDKRPEVQEFLTKYKAEYNSVPDSMAALGYDAANLLFDAMERAPSLSGPDLAKAIADTRGPKAFKAVTGKIDFDDNRNPTKLAVIQKLKGGEFSYFATVNP